MTVAQSNSISNFFTSCSFASTSGVDLESSEDEDIHSDEFLAIGTSIRSGVYPNSVYAKYVTPLLPTQPAPLSENYWTEPIASSFNVRGEKYIQDREKIPSPPSLFRLFAVDLVKVNKPILKGMCRHPNERVQQCLNAERTKKPGSAMPPFIFCVNITVPTKPAHHLVMYYAVDDFSLIDPSVLASTDGTNGKGKSKTVENFNVNANNAPFRRLASRFFFGNSDEFRDKTFKLIPRIVSGNFVVKKAVGSKPTILGKKLKQRYIQDDRFFELIVDVHSDKIAKKIVSLCSGHVSTVQNSL